MRPTKEQITRALTPVLTFLPARRHPSHTNDTLWPSLASHDAVRGAPQAVSLPRVQTNHLPTPRHPVPPASPPRPYPSSKQTHTEWSTPNPHTSPLSRQRRRGATFLSVSLHLICECKGSEISGPRSGRTCAGSWMRPGSCGTCPWRACGRTCGWPTGRACRGRRRPPTRRSAGRSRR